jgi:hypothetical protein
MDADEMCSLVISFSVLLVWNSKLVDDILSRVKKEVLTFNNTHLVQLASASKYIFSYEKYAELYKTIHDACVASKQNFSDNQIKILRRIYKDDGILTNSFFSK